MGALNAEAERLTGGRRCTAISRAAGGRHPPAAPSVASLERSGKGFGGLGEKAKLLAIGSNLDFG